MHNVIDRHVSKLFCLYQLTFDEQIKYQRKIDPVVVMYDVRHHLSPVWTEPVDLD